MSGGKAVQANAGWVLDNQKAACDGRFPLLSFEFRLF